MTSFFVVILCDISFSLPQHFRHLCRGSGKIWSMCRLRDAKSSV